MTDEIDSDANNTHELTAEVARDDNLCSTRSVNCTGCAVCLNVAGHRMFAVSIFHTIENSSRICIVIGAEAVVFHSRLRSAHLNAETGNRGRSES